MFNRINEIVYSIRNKGVPWLDKHSTLKSSAKSFRSFYSNTFGPFKMFPDYLIIGAKKAATTSLYRNLIKHSYVEPSLTKEIDYFNRYYFKGTNWYRSHFPISILKSLALKRGKNLIVGEASPTYIYHPHAPKRVKKLIPYTKLIVILRNPVDRAYSHYNMEVIHKNENQTFEDAIKNEEYRIKGEFEKMERNENYYSLKFENYSYLTSGIYIDQLKRWFQFFPKKQFNFIINEEFDVNPQKVFNQVFNFLDIPSLEIKNHLRYSQSSKNMKKMKSTTRKELIEYFKPYNEKLYSLLDLEMPWDK